MGVSTMISLMPGIRQGMVLYRAENMIDRMTGRICVYEIIVTKETPKGYWIDDGEKWVSKTATKRYAYPTHKEAIHSFLHRKRRQVAILKTSLKNANKFYSLAHAEYAVLTEDD